MKIKVLIENTAHDPALTAEHGLSLYIETNDRRILFDMGQTDAFAQNAAVMGVDLGTIDLAILSHGHYDHGGGLKTFLKRNDHAPVYVSRHAFADYYNGTEKYIGLDKGLSCEPRIHLVGDEMPLAPGLTLYSCNAAAPVQPLNAYGLTKRCGETFAPDDFLHEHYLLIKENGRRVLISGCSHKGVVNIAAWFRPDVLIGGFHFMKLTDAAALEDAAGQLLALPTRYYTGHCTGQEQYAALKARMGDRLSNLYTGRTIEI